MLILKRAPVGVDGEDSTRKVYKNFISIVVLVSLRKREYFWGF